MSNRVIKDSTELRKLILENPDLPIVVLVDDELCTGDYTWMYAPNVGCRIGELLDYDQGINDGKIYNDRDEFKEDLTDYILLECEPITDAEFDEKLRRELAFYEPYWEKCIIVWAGL